MKAINEKYLKQVKGGLGGGEQKPDLPPRLQAEQKDFYLLLNNKVVKNP